MANRRNIPTLYAGSEEPLNASAFDEIFLAPATEVLPQLL
jgi:hypothetical protein